MEANADCLRRLSEGAWSNYFGHLGRSIPGNHWIVCYLVPGKFSLPMMVPGSGELSDLFLKEAKKSRKARGC